MLENLGSSLEHVKTSQFIQKMAFGEPAESIVPRLFKHVTGFQDLTAVGRYA